MPGYLIRDILIALVFKYIYIYILQDLRRFDLLCDLIRLDVDYSHKWTRHWYFSAITEFH